MKSLKEFYRKELFHPTALSIFINPFYVVRKRLLQSIRKMSPKMHGKFIDFGCGAMPYKQVFKVNEFRGLDIKKSGHDVNEMHNDVIFYDGGEIPLESSSIDSVFASEVFEHIFELESTLGEINRILKPGGKLLITVPFIWEEHEVPYDFARYSSYGLSYILEKNQFQVEESVKIGSSIETCFQVFTAFIYSKFPKNKLLKLPLTVIIISPINMLVLLLDLIVPKSDKLYLNNLILAHKI